MLARQQVLSKPIRITTVLAADLPEVEHDSDQIHQVVLNLLLNAVQAIENSGSVTVTIGSQDDCATITVADTGRGMSEQQLSQIFRPFFTTRSAGTGLGLSLVRRIIDEHHGQIAVTSEPGNGSTFGVDPFHQRSPTRGSSLTNSPALRDVPILRSTECGPGSTSTAATEAIP